MDNGYGGNSMVFLATLTCYTIKYQIENDAKGKVK